MLMIKENDKVYVCKRLGSVFRSNIHLKFNQYTYTFQMSFRVRMIKESVSRYVSNKRDFSIEIN